MSLTTESWEKGIVRCVLVNFQEKSSHMSTIDFLYFYFILSEITLLDEFCETFKTFSYLCLASLWVVSAEFGSELITNNEQYKQLQA